jgi:hypothetical protein
MSNDLVKRGLSEQEISALKEIFSSLCKDLEKTEHYDNIVTASEMVEDLISERGLHLQEISKLEKLNATSEAQINLLDKTHTYMIENMENVCVSLEENLKLTEQQNSELVRELQEQSNQFEQERIYFEKQKESWEQEKIKLMAVLQSSNTLPSQ